MKLELGEPPRSRRVKSAYLGRHLSLGDRRGLRVQGTAKRKECNRVAASGALDPKHAAQRFHDNTCLAMDVNFIIFARKWYGQHGRLLESVVGCS